MNALVALIFMGILVLIPLVGAGGGNAHWLFAYGIPYAAITVFLIGFVTKILGWANSPVPFRIPTTSGQQKSLPWIEQSKLESPSNAWQTFLRMALEILFFRSLFRNTSTTLYKNEKIVYGSNKILWAAGLVFHYSFLVIFIRHFKYFAEPVPAFVQLAQGLDGFFQIGLPILYLTDLGLLAGLGVLLWRRFFDARLRYISLTTDYFALFLILGIGATGMMMRYLPAFRVDIVQVKQLGTGLLGGHPVAPDGIGSLFYIHLFLVSSLLAYFPFSKLMHLGGVFLSPTRNLANNNRMKRHINPWNPKLATHSYEEYEDDFRDVMRAAEMPLDKEN
ncbi:sulfate reduction electron transfer complex DsrMKJOP subunit DsrM [Calditrichota bacterium]